MHKKIFNAIKRLLEPIGMFVSSVVNFILLSIVYFMGIGLTSITAKLFGKHFLELKKQKKKTNWHEHKITKQPLEKYYRTF